ncbi:hypothetical protein C9374_007346 [Naegleria lovaniensis]|uniref:NADH-cytochrome b5 reductase n=1 Tax=Naegleria lovaniensis TaxID=51637 RepID=A0AA88GGV4_NAELO|nr:uncharacterized protein C9374_007346 [Naegleria lovaniensis]KAG2379207.1 hypothetical protein C9374_007346 [Naegleria lovaniensis]
MYRRLLVLAGGGAALTAGINRWRNPIPDNEQKFVNDLREFNTEKIEYENALNPEVFQTFKLKEVKPISHDTSIFTFALEDVDQVNEDGLKILKKLNMPVASCVFVKANVGDEVVVRPYTPINRNGDVGFMNLLIKAYPNGKLSKKIHEMKIGDSLEFKGPLLKYDYKPNMKKEMIFLSAGTGITPSYQLIQEILSNSNDSTKITLLYANKTPEDILLKKELDTLAKQHPNQFKVFYTVDADPNKTADASIQGRGFVNHEMLKQFGLPKPSSDVLVSVCGPPPFYDLLCGQKKSPKEQGEVTGLLKDKFGYNETNVFKF